MELLLTTLLQCMELLLTTLLQCMELLLTTLLQCMELLLTTLLQCMELLLTTLLQCMELLLTTLLQCMVANHVSYTCALCTLWPRREQLQESVIFFVLFSCSLLFFSNLVRRSKVDPGVPFPQVG